MLEPEATGLLKRERTSKGKRHRKGEGKEKYRERWESTFPECLLWTNHIICYLNIYMQKPFSLWLYPQLTGKESQAQWLQDLPKVKNTGLSGLQHWLFTAVVASQQTQAPSLSWSPVMSGGCGQVRSTGSLCASPPHPNQLHSFHVLGFLWCFYLKWESYSFKREGRKGLKNHCIKSSWLFPNSAWGWPSAEK